MVITCWAPKGGSGTTTVAAALAVERARRSPGGVLVVDGSGDLPAALGIPDPEGPGLLQWLAARSGVERDALGALEVDAGPNLRLVPFGSDHSPTGSLGPGREARAEALVALLGTDPRPVVVDGGSGSGVVSWALVAGATHSLAVLHPCYLALRRALAAPVRPSGVVVLQDEGRALSAADVSDVLGVAVLATIPFDPAVARAVDAGLLARRLPRSLDRAVSALAAALDSGPPGRSRLKASVIGARVAAAGGGS